MIRAGSAHRAAAAPSHIPFLLTPRHELANFPQLLIGDDILLPPRRSGHVHMVTPEETMELLRRNAVVPYGPCYPNPEAAYVYAGEKHQLPYMLKLHKSRVAVNMQDYLMSPAPLTFGNLEAYQLGRCHYSGRKLGRHEASLDHIIPQREFRLRGTNVINGIFINSWENVVIAERSINSQRGHTPYRQFLKAAGFEDTVGPRPHQPLRIEIIMRQIAQEADKMPPVWLEQMQDAVIWMLDKSKKQNEVTTGRLEYTAKWAMREISGHLRAQQEMPSLAA
mgnify:CR=1 FL=1